VALSTLYLRLCSAAISWTDQFVSQSAQPYNFETHELSESSKPITNLRTCWTALIGFGVFD